MFDVWHETVVPPKEYDIEGVKIKYTCFKSLQYQGYRAAITQIEQAIHLIFET